jgi:hypothetical protein
MIKPNLVYALPVHARHLIWTNELQLHHLLLINLVLNVVITVIRLL